MSHCTGPGVCAAPDRVRYHIVQLLEHVVYLQFAHLPFRSVFFQAPGATSEESFSITEHCFLYPSFFFFFSIHFCLYRLATRHLSR